MELYEEFVYNNTSQHLYRIEVVHNKTFIEKMEKLGIVCGIHYPALHLNSIYNGGMKLDCTNSKKLSYRTVSLPMNEKLSFLELEYIIDKVKELL